MKVVHNVNTFYTKFGGHATSFKDTGSNSEVRSLDENQF